MIQNIMTQAVDAANRQFETLDRVAQNVANINTTGYKIKRFEQYIRPGGEVAGVERQDYSQGSLMVSNRELDVAIDGPGFIPVTQPDGVTAFTRDGSFSKNRDGYLVTQYGDLVGEGIQLPVNYDKLQITASGEVKALLPGKLEPTLLGKIKVVNFANPEGLQSAGYNKLLPTEASGEPQPTGENVALKQGMVERANVNVLYQIDQVLRLNAGVLSNMRIAKFTDEIYRQSVNLKQ
ncbi:MAG: flagellar hook basal-body protein [Vampirovibrionales bacterium]|nr:flagellar hook basal-body protein [Vampirovibrionales bacterium]